MEGDTGYLAATLAVRGGMDLFVDGGADPNLALKKAADIWRELHAAKFADVCLDGTEEPSGVPPSEPPGQNGPAPETEVDPLDDPDWWKHNRN